MEGFGEAINGYFDVDDQLSRYLLSEATELHEAARTDKRSIDSRRAFERRRQHSRETFRSRIGGLPDRPADLSVEHIDRLAQDGYSIELLTYQSQPNFRVTANCYVPAGDGPHPAILFLCGHVDSPKGDTFNQKACIDLAANGFVVLIVDPIAQGERTQYRDPDTGEAIVSGGGGTFAHAYAGQKCFYAGINLARYMINDARCGLDYLHRRTDVDETRIGVTGSSGGGTQTLYLSLFDDRIAAAAPCCSVTVQHERMNTGGRTHAEQTIYGALDRGIDFDDLITAAAPRPLCIGAAASDRYFPIEGVHDVVERARRVYDLYDAESAVELVIADTTHCSVYELREGVFDWLCAQLAATTYEPAEEVPVLEKSALQCTPRGSIRAAYDDERTVDDLIREYVAETYPEAGAKPTLDDQGEHAEQVRAGLTERFDLDRVDADLHPRFVEQTTENGLELDSVFFKTERHPDIAVTGVLVTDPHANSGAPAIALYEHGTEELPERGADVASLAREHGTVFVFDPRGVGAVRNRQILVPNWADAYYGIYGTEFKLANDAFLLGSSLLGMRVYDVLRAVEFLRQETEAECVSFVGDGVGAYLALYASAVARDVTQVELREMGPSFAEMATDRVIPFHPQLTVFDVVGQFDVAHLIAALDQRDVRIDA